MRIFKIGFLVIIFLFSNLSYSQKVKDRVNFLDEISFVKPELILT